MKKTVILLVAMMLTGCERPLNGDELRQLQLEHEVLCVKPQVKGVKCPKEDRKEFPYR